MSAQVKTVIGLLLVSSFVVILNETIMGVALPNLMVELDITAATAQWLTTGFLLTMAVVIPMTGVVLQRFTTRAVFVTAMSLFTLGTLLAGLAPGFPMLISGRVVQAAGTALVLPLLITTVMNFVPADRRGRTMGLISIVIAVAPAVGPTFSGLILDSLNWRWLFFIVLPIAGLSLILGVILVKNITAPRPVRFDTISIALSALAFGGLIYGLSSIGEATEGHAPVSPAVPIAGGAILLVLFVFRQLSLQSHDAALLDLRPFGSRTFVVGVVMLLICMATLFGTLILLPIYMQSILGMSVLQTGLMLLPGGLSMGLIAPIVGRLFDRYGARPVVIPGAVIMAAAISLMTLASQSTPAASVIALHVLLSLGLGLVITPLMTSALGSLDESLYSHGSAIVNTLQQLAGAAGTALFVTVMTTRTSAGIEAGMDSIAAQAQGVQSAFLWGSILAVIAAVLSLFVRSTAGTARAASVH